MRYKTILGKTVELTSERKVHISKRHPDVIANFGKINQVLLAPDEIRIDTEDQNVLLFYRYFSTIGGGKYLVVVIKINRRSFILTCYATYRKKSGTLYELKKAT